MKNRRNGSHPIRMRLAAAALCCAMGLSACANEATQNALDEARIACIHGNEEACGHVGPIAAIAAEERQENTMKAVAAIALLPFFILLLKNN